MVRALTDDVITGLIRARDEAPKAMRNATAVYCPSCGRYLTEAEEVRGQKLRCSGCKLHPVINLVNGTLTVQVIRATE